MILFLVKVDPIQANFGGAFNIISPSNYTTSYSYTSNRKGIIFRGSYKMEASPVFPVPIGGFEFPIGKKFSWGTYQYLRFKSNIVYP